VLVDPFLAACGAPFEVATSAPEQAEAGRPEAAATPDAPDDGGTPDAATDTYVAEAGVDVDAGPAEPDEFIIRGCDPSLAAPSDDRPYNETATPYRSTPPTRHGSALAPWRARLASTARELVVTHSPSRRWRRPLAPAPRSSGAWPSTRVDAWRGVRRDGRRARSDGEIHYIECILSLACRTPSGAEDIEITNTFRLCSRRRAGPVRQGESVHLAAQRDAR